MPLLKLTKRSIDAIDPVTKPTPFYDSDLKGFGLMAQPSGARSFFVEKRMDGGGRGGRVQRMVIGKYGVLTPDEARKAARDLLARVALGENVAAAKAERRAAMTVSALIDAFEKEHVAKLKPSTGDSYKAGLDALRKAHGSLKAEALTRAQVASLHSGMNETPYAANRALAAWSKLYSWAADRGHVPEGHNPVQRVQRFRERARERFLTTAELAKLGDVLREAETVGLAWAVDETKPKAKHAPKESNRRRVLDPFAVAAIRLLILTGARVREVLDAQWQHLDTERGILFLPDSKTGKKPVYLSAVAQAVLAAIPRIDGNPFVIAGAKDGEPRADLKKPWSAISKAAGLGGLRLHDLRHSFASVGAGRSLGLPIIGKLLGHTQAATTARYAHLDADPLRRAVETIGADIDAAMNGKADGEVLPLRKRG